ncbi:MAG: four helix bundle protein [Planctomycetes bacterium]|nr:four helix bundle protein [Planctomycetota bacterium]
MDSIRFKNRTKAFALRVIRLVDALPNKRAAMRLCDQLLRSGTSVGANYRAACRARSRPDFIAKMKIVEEECDESLYWIELLVESLLVKERLVASLYQEGQEILAMVVASIKTSRAAPIVNRKL